MHKTSEENRNAAENIVKWMNERISNCPKEHIMSTVVRLQCACDASIGESDGACWVLGGLSVKENPIRTKFFSVRIDLDRVEKDIVCRANLFDAISEQLVTGWGTA